QPPLFAGQGRDFRAKAECAHARAASLEEKVDDALDLCRRDRTVGAKRGDDHREHAAQPQRRHGIQLPSSTSSSSSSASSSSTPRPGRSDGRVTWPSTASTFPWNSFQKSSLPVSGSTFGKYSTSGQT